MADLDQLEALLAKATPGEWRVIEYDCGDTPHYDHNGPCPSIQADDQQDCAIVHWDGFKQSYWSSANGNQRQIEANAALIVALRNAAPDLIAKARRVEELEAENDDLKSSVIAFGGPWAVKYAEEFGLPPGHLHPTHYDILQNAGARMDGFSRAALKENTDATSD